MDKYSTCCTCGAKWLTGQDGSHSCTEKLLFSLNLKKIVIREKNKGLGKKAAHIERLREAAQHFANFACSDGRETCECYNCKLRDVINSTPAQSLATIQADAIEKMADKWEKGLEHIDVGKSEVTTAIKMARFETEQLRH